MFTVHLDGSDHLQRDITSSQQFQGNDTSTLLGVMQQHIM